MSGILLCFARSVLPSSFVKQARGIITALLLVKLPEREEKQTRRFFLLQESNYLLSESQPIYISEERDTRCLLKKRPGMAFQRPSAWQPATTGAVATHNSGHPFLLQQFKKARFLAPAEVPLPAFPCLPNSCLWFPGRPHCFVAPCLCHLSGKHLPPAR